MKRLVTGAAALISAAMMMSCASKGEVKVLIENDSDLSRVNETVELDFNALKTGIEGLTADNAVVLDAEGKQVPVQVYTERHAEELLIFQASVPAGEAVEFTVSAGVREPYDTLVYSRYVPERADDYAYENNLFSGTSATTFWSISRCVCGEQASDASPPRYWLVTVSRATMSNSSLMP